MHKFYNHRFTPILRIAPNTSLQRITPFCKANLKATYVHEFRTLQLYPACITTPTNSTSTHKAVTMVEAKNLQLPQGQRLLGETNYPTWTSQVTFILQANGLEGFVDGTEPEVKKPATTTRSSDDAYSTWSKNNAYACLAITLNLAEEPTACVSGLTNAYEMWKALETQYKGTGHNVKQAYIHNLCNMEITEAAHIGQYIIDFKWNVNQLALLKCAAPEEWYIILFIQGVSKHDKFQQWTERQRSLARSTAPPTLSSLYTDLTDEARGIAPPRDRGGAFYGNKPGHGDKKEKKKCIYCKREGHLEPECHKAHPELRIQYLEKQLKTLKSGGKKKEDSENDDGPMVFKM